MSYQNYNYEYSKPSTNYTYTYTTSSSSSKDPYSTYSYTQGYSGLSVPKDLYGGNKDYTSNIGKDYSSITKDYSSFSKDYSNIGKDYSNIGKDYSNIGKDYSNIGKDYSNIGKDYSNIGKDYSSISKDYAAPKDYSYTVTSNIKDFQDKKYPDPISESTVKPEFSSFTTSNVQNKQALKTDPKALLPIFSGETKFKDETINLPEVKTNVVGKKDCTDELFDKFSNLTQNEITLKSNVGKALYAGSLAINSNDSAFYKELENCKKKGTPFIDRDFPANMESLAGNSSDFKRQCGNVTWKRGDALFKEKKFKLFEGKIEPRDILQGILGDCYFLSSCAAIAEQDYRIKRLFSYKDPSSQKITQLEDINPQGIYAVQICEKGVWKEVIVDDQIACDTRGDPILTKSNGPELWMMLLEKAWAKNYGNYWQIDGGLTREAMHDLTGAPCITLFIDQKNNKVVWEEIEKGERENFVMTAGSLGEDADVDLDSKGLVDGHAYSLLGAYFVESSQGKKELVKLRNPWGNFEWSGSWCDKDTRWNGVSQSEKNRIGYSTNDDGVFFMEFADFIHYYDAAQICYIHDDYKYFGFEVCSKANQGKFYKIDLPRRGEYIFSVSQSSVRHLPMDDQDNHSYARVTLKVADANGKILEEVNKGDRDVFSGFRQNKGMEVLQYEGTVYLYVSINWKSTKNESFGLSVYGVGDIDERNFVEVDANTAKNIDKQSKGYSSSSSGGAAAGGSAGSYGSYGGYTTTTTTATTGGYSGGYTGGYGGASSGGYGGGYGGYSAGYKF